MPHQASREEQIAVAERTLAAQGWNAWPACSRKMGVRGYSAEPGKPVSAVKAAAPAAKAAKSAGGKYTVTPGDTLTRIAASRGTTASKIFAANRGTLSSPHVLRVGQQLTL